MSNHFLLDVFCILGLIVGTGGMLAYRPLLMRKVRQHPKQNRREVDWSTVQTSLRHKHTDAHSLYVFIKLREATLSWVWWGGFILVCISVLMLL